MWYKCRFQLNKILNTVIGFVCGRLIFSTAIPYSLYRSDGGRGGQSGLCFCLFYPFLHTNTLSLAFSCTFSFSYFPLFSFLTSALLVFFLFFIHILISVPSVSLPFRPLPAAPHTHTHSDLPSLTFSLYFPSQLLSPFHTYRFHFVSTTSFSFSSYFILPLQATTYTHTHTITLIFILFNYLYSVFSHILISSSLSFVVIADAVVSIWQARILINMCTPGFFLNFPNY